MIRSSDGTIGRAACVVQLEVAPVDSAVGAVLVL